MDVQPEAVVAPDDVAQHLVVPAVVRRVDDPLLLPGAPGVGAGGAEEHVEAACELEELAPALAHHRHGLRERLAAAGAHLDLRSDQLADEVLFEGGALPRRLQLLEAVDEAERLRVEERELLLDRDREVPPGSKASRGSGSVRPESVAGRLPRARK